MKEFSNIPEYYRITDSLQYYFIHYGTLIVQYIYSNIFARRHTKILFVYQKS